MNLFQDLLISRGVVGMTLLLTCHVWGSVLKKRYLQARGIFLALNLLLSHTVHVYNVLRTQGYFNPNLAFQTGQTTAATETANTDNLELHLHEHPLETGFEALLAIRNYEAFHAMDEGAATIAEVQASSAGIVGWAYSSLGQDASLQPLSNNEQLNDSDVNKT